MGVVFAFIAELPIKYLPNLPNSAGFLGRFVVSYSGDSGESECHLAWVFGALLDFVVSDFDNDFGDNLDAVAFLADGGFF